MGSLDPVPYWHYNVPVEEKTAECPPFLVDVSDKDRRIIGSPDAAFSLLTWERVCAIIASNRLELFQRTPSDLRRYKAFTHALAGRHGSVADFILRERLRWPEPVTPSGRPFECADDVKMMRNDWPYGLDRRIVHLVVWTKFGLCEEPATGDLTDAARAEIDAFVSTTFRSRLHASQVNTISLARQRDSHHWTCALNPILGRVVQELVGAQVHPRRRTLSRHDVRSGSRLYPAHYRRRRAAMREAGAMTGSGSRPALSLDIATELDGSVMTTGMIHHETRNNDMMDESLVPSGTPLFFLLRQFYIDGEKHPCFVSLETRRVPWLPRGAKHMVGVCPELQGRGIGKGHRNRLFHRNREVRPGPVQGLVLLRPQVPADGLGEVGGQGLERAKGRGVHFLTMFCWLQKTRGAWLQSHLDDAGLEGVIDVD